MRRGCLLIHAISETQWVTTSSARTNIHKQNRFLFARYKKKQLQLRHVKQRDAHFQIS